MKRKIGILMMVAAMAPLGVASTAWACAALAKVRMDNKVVKPGQTVTVTGSGFSDTHSNPLSPLTGGDSAVALRLKNRTGRILKEVDASSGKIETSMKMPATMAPGYYVLLATQTQADGTAKAGTPARYAFRVTGTPVAQSVVASPWRSTPPSGPSSAPVAGDRGVNGQGWLVGGILALTLLAAGPVLAGRRNQMKTLGV